MLSWSRAIVVRFLSFGLFVIALAGVVGCGSDAPPVALGDKSVSGKVTYKGKALPSGQVVFVGSDGKPRLSTISAEGTYSFEKLPAGDFKVGISTGVSGSPPPQMPKDLEKHMASQKDIKDPVMPKVKPSVKIPDQYQDPEKSGLTYTVSGEKTQTKDWDLK